MNAIRHIIIFCGSGGVGKTTLSASMALKEALSHKDVYAQTIDPAKRLASILGLQNTISNISNPTGYDHLKASMLDVKNDLIELVKYYCLPPYNVNAILSNNLFKSFLNAASGSEEYVAWGKLFLILNSENCELLFVDTAPTNHALNFFKGPEKLLQILEPSRLLRLIKPFRINKERQPFQPQTAAGVILNKIIKSVLGIELLKDVGDLATALNFMFDDFRERVKQADRVLKDKRKTTIVLVTSPHFNSLMEAQIIAKSIISNDLPLKAVVFNKVAEATKGFDLKKILLSLQAEILPSSHLDDTIENLLSYLHKRIRRNDLEIARMKKLKKALPDYLHYISVPDMVRAENLVFDLKSIHPYIGKLSRVWHNR